MMMITTAWIVDYAGIEPHKNMQQLSKQFFKRHLIIVFDKPLVFIVTL